MRNLYYNIYKSPFKWFNIDFQKIRSVVFFFCGNCFNVYFLVLLPIFCLVKLLHLSVTHNIIEINVLICIGINICQIFPVYSGEGSGKQESDVQGQIGHCQQWKQSRLMTGKSILWYFFHAQETTLGLMSYLCDQLMNFQIPLHIGRTKLEWKWLKIWLLLDGLSCKNWLLVC